MLADEATALETKSDRHMTGLGGTEAFCTQGCWISCTLLNMTTGTTEANNAGVL